jgi:hypothetical protein
MIKACLSLTLCLLVVSFPHKSASITMKPRSADQTLPTKFDEYGSISVRNERRCLDKFARELQRNVGATTQILVYGRYQADVDARISRVKNYLVKNRRLNPYRVIAEGQACRRESKTELWIVPVGAVRPALTDDGMPTPCKVKSRKSDNE